MKDKGSDHVLPQTNNNPMLEMNFNLLRNTMIITSDSSTLELTKQQTKDLKHALSKVNI